MDTLTAAKAAIRQQVSQDIFEKLTELQKERPGVPFETVFAELQTKEAELFAYADKIETGEAWEPPKPEPVYRFIDTGKKGSAGSSLGEAAGLPMKVHGVLVEADHEGRLSRETQRLIDRTDGPLHREIAKHLVLDANPKLADAYEGQDDLEKSQLLIKARIKEMQARDPKKSFRQCWESLQRSDPELFRELPEA